MMVKSMLSNLLLECFKAFHVNSYMSNKLDNKQLLFVEEEKLWQKKCQNPARLVLVGTESVFVCVVKREKGASLFLSFFFLQ